ncbi:hypothetical protein Micbo1qcDRAFT_165149, partial [Microdochium bolleyi]
MGETLLSQSCDRPGFAPSTLDSTGLRPAGPATHTPLDGQSRRHVQGSGVHTAQPVPHPRNSLVL